MNGAGGNGPNGTPIEQIDASNNVSYLHQDQLGSTRVLTNQNRAVVGTYAYDPYGITTAHSGTSTPLQYAGQYNDNESNLYWMRARYYDPTTAQFITRDPIESQTRAAYTYVNGNPLNMTDPSGLFGWNDFKRNMMIGSAIVHDTIYGGQFDAKVIFPKESQTTANFAGGVLNSLSLGNEERIDSALGQQDHVDRSSGYYATGSYAGFAIGAGNISSIGRQVCSRTGLKIGGKRMARFHIDYRPHRESDGTFIGRHIQFDSWRAKEKGSGWSKRWPF